MPSLGLRLEGACTGFQQNQKLVFRRSPITMANHNIPRRPLGGTGLEVSVLSFGGSPIGGIYQVFSLALCS